MSALAICRYELKYATSAAVRVGALVRLSTKDGFGYGDLHPWPEIGDADLDTQLARLASGNATNLGTRTLAGCTADAEARAKGVSLFEGLTIPDSHWHLSSLAPTDQELQQAAAFHVFKAKISPAPDLALQLIALLDRLPPNALLRLDANAKFTPEGVVSFVRDMGGRHTRIDFLEDPSPDGNRWPRLQRETGVSFAMDRVFCADADTVVLKPAADDFRARMAEEMPDRWVLTSYLDHPVGQLHAAHAAALAKRSFPDWVDVCGLATQFAYEPNAFSEAIGMQGTRILPPAGPGIGYEEAMWASIPWKSLGA